MAQRTEKEETEFKVPDTLTLCVNNCGFNGNPSTNNMCQKCFSNASAAGIIAPLKVPGAETSRSSSSRLQGRTSEPFEDTDRRDLKDQDRITGVQAELFKQTTTVKRAVNRCSGCRRKVGLTGFRCRCGELFCADHRYSDRHDCSYDYKTAGREAIARENPVVKAAKIVKL